MAFDKFDAMLYKLQVWSISTATPRVSEASNITGQTLMRWRDKDIVNVIRQCHFLVKNVVG